MYRYINTLVDIENQNTWVPMSALCKRHFLTSGLTNPNAILNNKHLFQLPIPIAGKIPIC